MSAPLGKDQVHVRITLDVVLNANGEDPDYLTERMQSEVYRAIMGKTPSALTFDSDATLASHHFAIELVEDAPKADADLAYMLAHSWEDALKGKFTDGPYPQFNIEWLSKSRCFMRTAPGRTVFPFKEILEHIDHLSLKFINDLVSINETLFRTEFEHRDHASLVSKVSSASAASLAGRSFNAPKPDYQDWAYTLAPTWEDALLGRFDEGPYPTFDPRWVHDSCCFVKVNAITGEITIPYEDIVMHVNSVPAAFLDMVQTRFEELAQLNERKRIGVFMAAFGRSCSFIEPAPQVEPARSSFSHLSRQR